MFGKSPHARHPESQYLDGSIPAAHDLGGFQAVVVNLAVVGMIEPVTRLPANVEQVPDRESFFASQHRGDAVALDIFHGDAKRAVDFARAVDRSDVLTANGFSGFHLFQQRLLEVACTLPKRA